MERIGRYTLRLSGNTGIIGSAAVVGKTEGEGPLAEEFDYIYPDDGMGQSSWEQAETVMHNKAITTAIGKSGITADDVDMIFAGDLLDQCVSSTFGIRELNIPFAGVYGACSTMALSLACASVFVDANAARIAVASTSSHFCAAEKQFRFPLEYGGQRTPTSQRTATASGAAVAAQNQSGGIIVDKVCFGRIQDLGITDSNNMGAAMAPVNVIMGLHKKHKAVCGLSLHTKLRNRGDEQQNTLRYAKLIFVLLKLSFRFLNEHP